MILVACMALLLAGSQTAPDSTRSTAAPPGHHEQFGSAFMGGERMLQGYFLRNRPDSPTTGYLSMEFGRSTMPWLEPPTCFDAAMQGAGAAATIGLFLGAIGNTTGLFDERTSWILAGSMAAAGAGIAGVRAEVQPRLRFDDAWRKR